MLLQGIDFFGLPMDRALNVAYSVLMSSAQEEKDRFRIESQLNQPIAAQASRDRDDFWSTAEADGQAFMAAMTQQPSLSK
ncbi:hypothetical protein QRX50_31640 [Amycolatopsis carbonis]|uniref:Uncharacterized protein n=1 Tax=Amycolatopsis carbonis TaxID=715471 RepID=A0A9Y2MSL4_9PSEU|nr:hypothetical protein [Amycolatopsis sp. 2-15]WIX76013.1 hypothetical protein QRX50_31640 [Amycolatopsis sp. 2-15]